MIHVCSIFMMVLIAITIDTVDTRIDVQRSDVIYISWKKDVRRGV